MITASVEPINDSRRDIVSAAEYSFNGAPLGPSEYLPPVRFDQSVGSMNFSGEMAPYGAILHGGYNSPVFAAPNNGYPSPSYDLQPTGQVCLPRLIAPGEGDVTEVLKPKGGQSFQDIIRLYDLVINKSTHSPEPILRKIMPNGRAEGAFFSDGSYRVALKMFNQKEKKWEPTYFRDGAESDGRMRESYTTHFAGQWKDRANTVCGNDVISLYAYRVGCNYATAMNECACLLGIDFNQCDAPQYTGGGENMFEPYPERGPGFVNHPVLGVPHCSYGFTNEHGRLMFGAHEWGDASGNSVVLFQTAQYDNSLRMVLWKFIAPPSELVLFNRQQLVQRPDLPVVIFDNLNWAASSQDNVGFVSTWAGELSAVAEIDWSLLAGREVKVCCDIENKKSVELFDKLASFLPELGCSVHPFKVAKNS
ncbi:hypothetical protein [Maridesulfovibrio sp.]|uniref:hypothetical protein n=1 Tax=Maridesulfovibrio sp. TaxID=2795000 RepID=UPI003AFFD40F